MPPAQETTAATAVVVETAAPGPTPLKEKTASDSAVEPQEAQPAKPSKGKAKRFTAPVKKAAETEAAGAVLESSADTKEKATEGKPKPKGKVTAKAAKKAKEHKETSLTAEASDAATAGAVIVDGSGTTTTATEKSVKPNKAAPATVVQVNQEAENSVEESTDGDAVAQPPAAQGSPDTMSETTREVESQTTQPKAKRKSPAKTKTSTTPADGTCDAGALADVVSGKEAKTAEEGEAPLTKPKAKRKSPTKKVKADASTADGASEAAADALSDDSPGKKAKTANDGEAPSSKPKPKRKSPVKKVKKGTATAEEPSGAAVLTEASVEHGTAKKTVPADEGKPLTTKPKAKRKSPVKKGKEDALGAEGSSEPAAKALTEDSPGKKAKIAVEDVAAAELPTEAIVAATDDSKMYATSAADTTIGATAAGADDATPDSTTLPSVVEGVPATEPAEAGTVTEITK